MNLVWFILIGIAAGWLAGQIMGGGGFGLLGDLILGVIGCWWAATCSACWESPPAA